MTTTAEKLKMAQVCIDDVASLFEHQLNVVRGNVVQLYYAVPDIETRAKDEFIFMQDEFLCLLAKNFTGTESYNQGVHENFRNFDILFQDYLRAEEFKRTLRLNYPQFKLHENIMHIGREITDVKTVQDVILRKNKTIEAYCGKLIVHFPPNSFAPVTVSHPPNSIL